MRVQWKLQEKAGVCGSKEGGAGRNTKKQWRGPAGRRGVEKTWKTMSWGLHEWYVCGGTTGAAGRPKVFLGVARAGWPKGTANVRERVLGGGAHKGRLACKGGMACEQDGCKWKSGM